MIINCPNCDKKFEIDKKLILPDGRLLQCGSCNHKWFFKIENNERNIEIEEKTIGYEPSRRPSRGRETQSIYELRPEQRERDEEDKQRGIETITPDKETKTGFLEEKYTIVLIKL